MTEDKSKRRPIIDPLIMILKSRRVIIALVSLLVGSVILIAPELQLVHQELLTLVLALALILIGGLSIEDAVIAARQIPVENDVRELVEAAMDAIVDEAFDEMEKTLWYDGQTRINQPE